MSNKNNNVIVRSGIRFGSLLQLVFIVLKLCKVIDWKWVWVLSPIWIGTGITVLALIVMIIVIRKINGGE